jgi:hypothetical protein
MPTAQGEFRQDDIDVARKGEAPLAQIAKDSGFRHDVETLARDRRAQETGTVGAGPVVQTLSVHNRAGGTVPPAPAPSQGEPMQTRSPAEHHMRHLPPSPPSRGTPPDAAPEPGTEHSPGHSPRSQHGLAQPLTPLLRGARRSTNDAACPEEDTEMSPQVDSGSLHHPPDPQHLPLRRPPVLARNVL